MGDIITLYGHQIPLDDNKKGEFIVDMARFAEGILTEKWIKRKYRFDDATWEKLGDDDALVELIDSKKLERIRNGDHAREKAQIHFADAPDVLGGILKDTGASPRHRIESAKELRAVAAVGPEAAPAADRFQIVINLGADCIERYDKSISINANDVGPNDDTTPQEMLTVIATNKTKDGGSGEPI